ncbi:MAG: Na(+)-translocating NADH-quinone reductase subunit A [Bacteroidales bacterium]|nr:Na(+)-translocating NADH-quinone reductase subunit A [Bacteroidales bacterium]
MSKTIRIRKGLDINLKGEAEKVMLDENLPNLYALKPIDFTGLVPKLQLKEGENVKKGEIVFFDKYRPQIGFASPVSGNISKVVRGDKRKMLEIIISKTESIDCVKHNISDYDLNREEDIKKLILVAGLWPFIKQRPYGIIANPEDSPRDIFISMFDSAPLSPDVEFVLNDKKEQVNFALSVLRKLTKGDLYLGFRKDSNLVSLINNSADYKINYFYGPHPSGLPGVQINKIAPINKGDIIWTINPCDLAIIGDFLLTGIYNPERIIALAGSEIKKPAYFKTIAGADISGALKDNLKSNNVRVISGNVLTGSNISHSQYLGFYDSLVTVIPEGNEHEMFGWAMPGLNKLSMSQTFLSSLLPKKKFVANTNLHGGHRAYVVTGQYEKVCPIDIYPQLLIKAILAEDIDKMEQMGIYEIIEEDLALCEFACTSKTDVQDIIRKGLDIMIKEMS